MAVQIRAGAALADPALRQAVERDMAKWRRLLWWSVLIVPAIFVLPTGLTWLGLAKRRREVLANNQWQVYPCKFGRWTWKTNPDDNSTQAQLTGFGKTNWVQDHHWVLILDPATGQPLAQLEMRAADAQPDYHGLQKTMPYAEVEFAGDFRTGGVIRAARSGLIGATTRQGVVSAAFPAGPWVADSPEAPVGAPGR